MANRTPPAANAAPRSDTLPGLMGVTRRTKPERVPQRGEDFYWLNLLQYLVRTCQPVWTSGNQFIVLNVLADHADAQTGICYPSLARIANRSNLSRRTVMRTIAELRKDQRIKVRDHARARGTDEFILIFDRATGDKLTPVAVDSTGVNLSATGVNLAGTEANLAARPGSTCHATGDKLTPKPSMEPSSTEPSLEARTNLGKAAPSAPPADDDEDAWEKTRPLTSEEFDGLVYLAFDVAKGVARGGDKSQLCDEIVSRGRDVGMRCDLVDAEQAVDVAMDILESKKADEAEAEERRQLLAATKQRIIAGAAPIASG